MKRATLVKFGTRTPLMGKKGSKFMDIENVEGRVRVVNKWTLDVHVGLVLKKYGGLINLLYK